MNCSLLKGGADYRKTLRRRLAAFIAMTLLGGGMIAVAHTVLEQSTLHDFIKGFYAGVGYGLTGFGLLLVIITVVRLRDPEKAKARQLEENDEREQAIGRQACASTFGIMYFAICAAAVIALPFSMTVFFALFAVMAANALVLISALFWTRRHM